MTTQHHINNIKKKEFTLFSSENSPFSLKNLQDIEALCAKVKYESIAQGDAGDMHQLKVGRFRRDTTSPIDTSEHCKDLMTIINSEKLKCFYKDITGLDNVCIRRAQSNILNPGNYVGLHIDGKGDPKYNGTHIDYQYAIVLHFQLNYIGGDTLLHTHEGIERIRLPEYSMLIITGSLPHEVEAVVSGARHTLVYFLSDNFGLSRYE